MQNGKLVLEVQDFEPVSINLRALSGLDRPPWALKKELRIPVPGGQLMRGAKTEYKLYFPMS